MGESTRRTVLLLSVAALVAALTALVFLIRAGGDPSDAATWPITWELRSSDNGVLFQLVQDVVAGRELDWSFSPQVFVFPELPLSAIAFVVSGGSIWGYYLVVAMLNSAGLFLVLAGLVHVLFTAATWGESVVRAALATTPLLVLPLLGTSWTLSFHLAPTYYFGMYAALLAGPAMVLAPARRVRGLIAVAIALTAASNPLVLVFAAPGAAAALVLFGVRRGWQSARNAGLLVGSVLLGALALRLLFSPLQGTSPLTYVDPDVFAGRLARIGPYFAYQARDPAAAVVLTGGAVLAVLCLAAAVTAAIGYLRRRGSDRLLAVVALGLVPLGGLAATLAAMITHYLYFWPVLVLPYVLVLLAVPRAAVPAAAASGAAALLAIAIATGLTGNLGTADRYVGYRNAETRCLEEVAPGGLGYATFSDARRLSLTSATGLRLIQVESDLQPSHWLTNRAYSTSEAGTFFYINGSGDEVPIAALVLASRFGAPDRQVSCAAGQSVLIYDDPAKLASIRAFYLV